MKNLILKTHYYNKYLNTLLITNILYQFIIKECCYSNMQTFDDEKMRISSLQ